MKPSVSNSLFSTIALFLPSHIVSAKYIEHSISRYKFVEYYLNTNMTCDVLLV